MKNWGFGFVVPCDAAWRSGQRNVFFVAQWIWMCAVFSTLQDIFLFFLKENIL